jgi:aspartate/methionine/tyrosine aminotransferase
MLNPRLDELMTYPFERLTRMLDGVSPPHGVTPISLAVGEPHHAPPPFVATLLAAHADDWGRYPPNRGTPGFRAAIADWLTTRYDLPQDFIDGETHVLPSAGTREALFMFALVAVPQGATGAAPSGHLPAVLVPNPLYHVYAGAAVMAGAEPVFLSARAENRFLPDFGSLPPDLLDRVALAYLCSPSNPEGAAVSLDDLTDLIDLAMAHDFIVAVDECYSEIYDRDPPVGALQAAAAFGARRGDALEHVVVFNSLSKRSSAPGLRSGFVTGGAEAIAAFARLRNFASCQTPLPIVTVAEHLWRDEAHVRAARAGYRARFDVAESALGGRYGFYRPDGGFFLWLDVGDGATAARRLWAEAGVRVLPGTCLCPDEPEHQPPGARHIRLALVHEPDTIGEALTRLRRVLN